MLREKPEFYKEEVRCGYTVNEKTKRVWAVQLEMLDEVERICKANGLKYFADSGTLIGAIRHEGYIPWDDDIDLVMLREDYDKFVQIAPKWLKEDLVLQTVYTEKNYLRGHAQIRNSKTCGCNEEDKKAGYNCGIFIDIFPLDGMPKTEKERKSWETKEAFSPVLGEMDKQIGRFIKALDDMGLSENTIIIFTSDNGPAPSFKAVRSAYLRGTKNSLYEGGIRMPFIVKYPKKIKPGRVNNSSVLCAVDLYPTLCSVAGIKTEKNYKGDGQNYAKVLLGKSEAKRKTDLMWDFGRNKHFGFPGNPYDRSPHLAIRSGKWKLLVNGDGSDAQLYDMELDKFEKNNIAGEHPELVAKLSKKVCEWYAQNKDKGLQTDL